MQNSETVLWSRRANDADQATLLIALLRASGIPARFVRGNIRMSMAQLMHWVGAAAPIAADAMTRFALENFSVSGNQVTVGHLWVEAFVGGSWISLAPSFKTYQ